MTRRRWLFTVAAAFLFLAWFADANRVSGWLTIVLVLGATLTAGAAAVTDRVVHRG